jgi:hypothetical protein
VLRTRLTGLFVHRQRSYAHLRPVCVKEHAFFHVPGDTDIVYVAHVQVDATQATTKVGVPHLQRACNRGTLAIALDFLIPLKDLQVGTHALGRRRRWAKRGRAFNFQLFDRDRTHALG